MATLLKDRQALLFVGDSITDCERRTTERPLGNGYVKLFNDLLIIREPQKRIHILNKGISGDRVTNLQTRWHDDVLRQQPDWLSIQVGINDLHSTLLQAPEIVPPEKFRITYQAILERTRNELAQCQILLITPFYMSTENSIQSFRHQVLELMPEYIQIVVDMSKRFQTRLLNPHWIFQNLLKYHEPDLFCPEPIHPNLTGHMVLAEAVYQTLCE